MLLVTGYDTFHVFAWSLYYRKLIGSGSNNLLVLKSLVITVESRFNESQFNVMSRFKVQNDVT